MRLPTFSRVTWRMMRAAGAVELHVHGRARRFAGRSRPGRSVMRSPVSDDLRRTSTGAPLRSGRGTSSVPHGRRLVLVLLEGGLARAGRVLLGHHADLEGGGAPDDLLGAGGSCTPGELHHDAVRPLLLDDRLGDAQLVDAVAQRLDVLLQRRLLVGLHHLRLDRRHERVRVLLAHGEVGHLLGEHPLGRVALAGLAEVDHDALALAGDPGVADLLVAQVRAHVARVAVDRLALARSSCRPAAGSARRRAGRGRGTWAWRRAPAASAGSWARGSAPPRSCGPALAWITSLALSWASVSGKRMRSASPDVSTSVGGTPAAFSAASRLVRSSSVDLHRGAHARDLHRGHLAEQVRRG